MLLLQAISDAMMHYYDKKLNYRLFKIFDANFSTTVKSL